VIEVPTRRQRIVEAPEELDVLVRLLVRRITGTRDRSVAAAISEAVRSSVPSGYSWPGNVRELEQAVRRVLLTGRYAGDVAETPTDEEALLVGKVRAGELTADELLGGYCALLYRRLGTYSDVAKRTGLDPRTTRKHVLNGRTAFRQVTPSATGKKDPV